MLPRFVPCLDAGERKRSIFLRKNFPNVSETVENQCKISIQGLLPPIAPFGRFHSVNGLFGPFCLPGLAVRPFGSVAAGAAAASNGGGRSPAPGRKRRQTKSVCRLRWRCVGAEPRWAGVRSQRDARPLADLHIAHLFAVDDQTDGRAHLVDAVVAGSSRIDGQQRVDGVVHHAQDV